MRKSLRGGKKKNNTFVFIHEICCPMDGLFEYVLVFGAKLCYVKVMQMEMKGLSLTKLQQDGNMTDRRI